jgi:hypothetical protein
LKDNHPTLASDVTELFSAAPDDDFAGLSHQEHTAHDEGHGRTETRHYYQMNDRDDDHARQQVEQVDVAVRLVEVLEVVGDVEQAGTL